MKTAAVTSSAVALCACVSKETLEQFLHGEFRYMSKDEIAKVLQRLEAQYTKKYGKNRGCRALQKKDNRRDTRRGDKTGNR